jgi:flagellar motor switch protein FliM
VSDILSQDEIEALLSSLTMEDSSSGSEESSRSSSPAPGSAFGGFIPSTKLGGSGPVSYEVYDFRRPDKFSKEQLRTLQMLHETFGRAAATGLSTYLRTPVSIDLISLEQVPYEEYLRSINKSVFGVLALQPLTGEAAFEIEFDLVFVMIDKLLGGAGRTVNRANLTDIESPLLRQIIERLLQALKQSWDGVALVNPAIESIETSGQFVQIAPPSDVVVSILFEVRVGETRGAMSLCIPYMVLKPITTKLSAQKWFMTGGSRKQSPINRSSIASMIRDAEVKCSFKLGTSKITVREFLSLRPGDIIRLDQKHTKDLAMLVAGHTKFEGQPALERNKYVFQVTQHYKPR